MSISFAATPQAKEGQQARAYTDDVSAGAPPSRRTGYDRPYVNRDHWNKVFTQPEYFDSIAKQKGMVEGAKVSLHGDDYVYRQAMMGYLSATRNVPLDDMRSVFDAEKDGFAQKVLGKKTATARELFDWHKTKFERENEKNDAARTVIEDVIKTSLQDSLSGSETPFVESVAKSIEATGDLFTEEEKSRLWEKAEEQDKQIRATQAAVAPEARFLFSALGQTTGQQAGMGAPDMREVAGKFAQLPDNQRKAIYELVGGFAQLQQVDKGFWYQMAESLGRGTTAFTERIPRNFHEQTLRGQLRLLESEQPVFRATGVAGAEFSAAGSTPATPEEREQAKAKIQSDLGILKVEREIRDLAERVVDPIKTVTFLPEIVEEGLYGAAQSIPYTVAAAVPYVGMPAVASALFSANYDSIMLQYDGIDPDKAALIAAISAPIEAGLERMKVNTLMGRTPIVAGLFKRLQHPNQRNLTRILIGSGAIVAEQNVQEVLQNATFPLIQTVAAALDQDMPDYDWAKRIEGMPRELAVQFVALLPLSLMGIGALSHREMTRGADYIRNKSNLERMGYGEDQIDRITGAATADEAQTILQDESGKRDPEAVKAAAQRVLDEVLALREQKAPASLPRLEKQGADYVVLQPDGTVITRSTDQTAAEQALVSARRETVQREMRDVHTGINEAVEFIKKVNEARQRGEDVAKVIRESAPRTLLTDYEANPTQENLDRLFDTVRAFGQEINEPAELASFPVIGSNQGALAEGIWRSVIRINEGADGTIVMREFAQDNLKRAISEGRTTMDFVRQQLNDVLPQIDSSRIKRQLRTETDTDVIEAFSDVALAYFRGSIREEQIPAGLRGIMRRLAIISRDIFRRAYNLARLRAEGKLDRDFEALLAEAVGVNQQALVDRARERTEQEVGAGQNYSIGDEGQKRAKAGGEVGPNGEWYEGGTWIARTDMPKKEKERLLRAATGREQVEVGYGSDKWAVPPAGKIPIVSRLLGKSIGPNGGANEQMMEYMKFSEDHKAQTREAARRFAKGDRYLDVSEFPLLANYSDAARMLEDGLPIPFELLRLLPDVAAQRIVQEQYLAGLREPDATGFNETKLPNGKVRFLAYHGSEQPISQLDDRPIYVSSLADGAGYGDATRMVIEGRFLPVDEIEAFAAKNGIAMEDLFHEEASMEQDLQESLRVEGYDGAMYYDQRRDDGDVMPAAVIVNPNAIQVAPVANYSIAVPSEVDEAAVYDSVLKLAGSRKWDRGRDLKMAMQEAVLARAQAAGVDVSDMSPETKAYLVRVALRDALFALKQNPNAIGWYDIKTRQALAVMALIHPEIGTDENARFAFTWILAVTSNGLKVDKNFDLAEEVYRGYKKKKVMPTNVGIGTAGKAINNSLKLFNRLSKEWGIDKFRNFTKTRFQVSEISSIDKTLKPSGEFSATQVRGAAIAGPKIGNGFFSNLNGFFDALTMDRWLIRTWGRWTGTLIKAMPEQTTKATERLQKAVEALTSEQASELSAVIVMDIPTATMPDLAQALAKASMDKEIREALNNVSEELRKSGNSLAKYLDGQKEAPSGPAERNNVREIFQSVLDELRATEEYKDLTMADLQAVLWYAEKRLYESAKEDFIDDDETSGYADNEAPDYANAAAKVARDKGVSEARISKSLTDTANVTTRGTRPSDGGSSGATEGQRGAAGGFTEGQKRLFRGNVAVRTVRRGRGSNAAPSWSYSREGSGDGGSVRVLKKIAVKYTASYKAGRDLRRVFRNNDIEAPRFVELVQDEANAQRFSELIAASKKASKFGAAVYVYPANEYQSMRLFLSEDGTTGFALKSNGDIVSVFSTGGAGHGALELAVTEGGTRLDAFDTILPDYYSAHGFVAVSRLNWDDLQAPDGWDKALYKEFNNGEPDVVFMAHQQSYLSWYSQNDGTVYTNYNDAVDAQDRAVADAATGANISKSNYSIATQSEIDRVQKAMGALDRSPLDTLEISEKLRKRFASIMAENIVELAAMRQGNVAQREVLDEEGNPIGPQPDAPRTKATGAEIRRTKLLQALGELDALLSALPPQVASKVGGYTVLANIGTGDRALSNFFVKRLEMIDKELERYLKDRYTKALDELFKRAKPKRSAAGEKPKGKLGADVHSLFDRLEQAVDQKAVEIDGEIASLEQQIASGELEPEQEAYSILLSDALPLFGEWATADASRMAQAVQMGYDIFRVAYKKQQAKAMLRKNLRDQERIDAKDASGAPDDTAPVRQKNKNEAEDFKSKTKGIVTNLLSFDQLMSLTFGRDSEFTKKWVNWQRKADNARDDEINAIYDQYAQFLATLTGHPKPYSMKATYAGQDLGYELALPQHKIKHTNVFGEEVEFEFSQADLMDITMMGMQAKGKTHLLGRLDDDGNPMSDWHYDQSFIDKAERLLTDETKAIRNFLLNDYGNEWGALNEVFVELNDINLPQEQFYSPLSVNPVQTTQNQTIDALTGFAIAVPNRTPPSLRSRGAAVAEPVFSNAIDKWFAHRMQMAHWKAYAKFNNEALSVLGHRNVRNAVEAKMGPAGLVSLQHYLTYFQQGGNRAADANLELTKALRGILGRAMTMSLFGRIGTVLIQFTQLGAASAKMPVHAYLRRFFKLMSGQMGWGEALNSPYIQRRIAQMPPQVQVAMAGLRANKPSQIREAARRVGWLLSGNDGLSTAGTYAMVYDYQLEQMKKAGMTGAEAEAAAREEAERTVDEIAQPTRAGARSAFELSQTSPLQTVAWAFGSEPRKNLAMLAYLQRAKRPLNEKGRALLYVLVFNGVFAALMRTMLRDLRDDDDDEIFDWDDTWNPKRLLMMVLTEPLYGVPVLGEMTEEAIFRAAREYQPEGSLYSVADPAFSLSRVPQHFSNLLEGEVDGRMVVKDINSILRGFGYAYPTAAGAAALSNLGKEFYEMGDTIFGDDE
jgi:hypothetical protein